MTPVSASSDGGSIRSGIHLGSCQILGHLHSGATGEFWLALDKEREGRFVVCKVLQPWVRARRADFVSALQQKVKLACRLSHPNLVRVERLEAAGDTDFLVLEYVPGKSLERLRHTPPPIFSLLVVAQLCEALEYLHTQTLTPEDPSLSRHLCLSPAKVIISASGIVKLLGCTALVHEGLQNIPTYVRYARFAFYAPERLGNREVDPRTDVYGVGAVLYFLLTGQPPFTAGSLLQLIQRVREGNPTAIEQLSPSVPAGVQRICDRAMAADPEARFASAAELRAAILELVKSCSDAQTARSLRAYLKDTLPDLPNLVGLLSALPQSAAVPPKTPAVPESSAVTSVDPPPPPKPPDASSPPPPEPTQSTEEAVPEVRGVELFPSRAVVPLRREVDLFATRASAAPVERPAIFPTARPRGARSEGDLFAGRPASRAPSPPPEEARPKVADLFASARPTSQPASAAKLDPFARAEHESDVFSIGSLPGRPRGAVEIPTRASRRKSDDRQPLSSDHGRSADPWRQAPAADPIRQASAHFDEGVAALRRGEREAAIRALEAAVALDPENRLYRTNLQLLRGG